MQWLTLTQSDNRTIFVNFDHAISIQRLEGHDITVIMTDGTNGSAFYSVTVKETPDEIFKRLVTRAPSAKRR